MALQEFIRESIEINWEWLERYLDGLTQEEIEYRPNDQCHSIGFVVWHYGRALDMWTQSLARRQPQLYEQEWAGRLGMKPEAMDVGFGYSVEDLNNWRCPDKALLVQYAAAARDNFLGFLGEHDDRFADHHHDDQPSGQRNNPGDYVPYAGVGGQPARRAGGLPARDAARSGAVGRHSRDDCPLTGFVTHCQQASF